MFKLVTGCWLAIFSLVILCTIIIFVNSSVTAAPLAEPENAASVRNSTPPNSGNLTYHGGPVITTSQTVYFIYWQPSGYYYGPRYRSLIDGFMKNVELDIGKTTNIYGSLGQYKDGNGQSASTAVTFGGSVVDTAPFPANGCTNSYTSVCLNNDQIRTKIENTMAAQGWIAGFNKLYFIMLPKNVGSCYDSTNNFCAFQDYCGFHAYNGDTTTPLIYSTIMYAMTVPSKCGTFSHPNGDNADSSINIISHEHGELITDPLHSAWYNSDKRERADKCFWQFGAHLGWTAYGKYNQVLGTGKYYLQSQWSNQSNSCVLRSCFITTKAVKKGGVKLKNGKIRGKLLVCKYLTEKLTLLTSQKLSGNLFSHTYPLLVQLGDPRSGIGATCWMPSFMLLKLAANGGLCRAIYHPGKASIAISAG